MLRRVTCVFGMFTRRIKGIMLSSFNFRQDSFNR